MVKVFSESYNRSIKIDRFIGYHKGETDGPTLIFIAGIHGNEPAGVFALHEVFQDLEDKNIPVSGSIYGISGNLPALQQGIRYHKQDLNRLWFKDTIDHLLDPSNQDLSIEEQELVSIYNTIQEILSTETGPFYFFDLHTTSSNTDPFLTVNDNLLNRKFTLQYPIRMILGIEEYLDGPLLSYINELGYVSFGFEAGQHNDPNTIANNTAFVYLTMCYTGSVKKNDINYNLYYNWLSNQLSKPETVFEIFWRHEIKPGEDFKMEPGFSSFQRIHKGQLLATSNNVKITATDNGYIFMPLYQNQGDDGFFLIKKTPSFFLKLSALLRKIRFDHILPLLPGIRWKSERKEALHINLKVARFFTKQFFHLIGYRNKQIDETHLMVKNREAASRDQDYQNTVWN